MTAPSAGSMPGACLPLAALMRLGAGAAFDRGRAAEERLDRTRTASGLVAMSKGPPDGFKARVNQIVQWPPASPYKRGSQRRPIGPPGIYGLLGGRAAAAE